MVIGNKMKGGLEGNFDISMIFTIRMDVLRITFLKIHVLLKLVEVHKNVRILGSASLHDSPGQK